AAGLVALARPEARAVRREHLIDDHERAIRQRAELEFRVGDDDARLLRHLAATLIDREAALAQLVRELVADATLHLVERDVLVVLTDLRLRRRREDRRIQTRALRQPLRQGLTSQGPVRLVLLPRRARDVA